MLWTCFCHHSESDRSSTKMSESYRDIGWLSWWQSNPGQMKPNNIEITKCYRVWSTWKGQVIPPWLPLSQTASFLILPGLTFHHLPSWVWLFITPSQSYLQWFIATGRTNSTFNWPVTLNVTALVVFNLDASDMAWHSTFNRSHITLLHELPWHLDLILSTSTLCRPSSAKFIKVQY